ncbi:unnamed protein product, partial [Sphacelaria rigidula]
MENANTGKGWANRQCKMPVEGKYKSKELVPWKRDKKYTIMLLGMSGAGKSRLGNDLLNVGVSNDDYKEFFPEGGGHMRCTEKVSHGTSTNKLLTVIDTPSITDWTPANTRKHFDAIFEELRRVKYINLLVFVAHEGRTNAAQFTRYGLLMKQLNRVRCAKLMVCRQSAFSPRQSDEA